MCLPPQVISLFILSMIHLDEPLSQSFKGKDGAVQIFIGKAGINNPDGQDVCTQQLIP